MSEVRLIDADALKRKINAFYDKLFVGFVSSDLITYASGVDGIIDNAPTVDERPQGEWIPVDEGLPEALQSVLVTSKSGRVYTSYIAHGDWEYGGEVIAWQPLPKPYKKGDTE